ncbi:pyridoxal-phosphate dependent enzyme [Roseovarius aestuarii]|uniref:L-threonine dehydratase catabolic TdcB n=2 Tax=Roseovarius aestuarii TaxID=475083 RepID=A0A1X7BWR8_9RHOB|nr:pyridoxal-phosphate dependent enzyme [Roseovarius aestuarii]SMC14088.1 L-threonine dehydratase catabolic TdcB [Roseovarius aestuarii]
MAQSADRSVQARPRIRELIYETPTLPSQTLGVKTGCDLWFKAENFQLTGSFKMRGAASKMTAMAPGQKLVTASSGNHGIAASRAASLTGQDLTVVLPETVARAKLEKIQSFGVEIILHGAESGMAEMHAQSLAAGGKFTYVSPYNDHDVIAGQGTIGLEVLEQVDRVDNIFIAMGGGGLISGIGSVLKSFGQGTRVIGVSAENSAALAASMTAGKVVETQHLDTLADGVAGGVDEDSVTLPLARDVIDQVVHCTEVEIGAALKQLAVDENMLVEGAAALALAGFSQISDQLRGQTTVVLLCGANFDWTKVRPFINS